MTYYYIEPDPMSNERVPPKLRDKRELLRVILKGYVTECIELKKLMKNSFGAMRGEATKSYLCDSTRSARACMLAMAIIRDRCNPMDVIEHTTYDMPDVGLIQYLVETYGSVEVNSQCNWNSIERAWEEHINCCHMEYNQVALESMTG